MLDCIDAVSCGWFTMPPVELVPVELAPVEPLVEPDVPEVVPDVERPVVPDEDDWAARCGTTDNPSPTTTTLLQREFLRT